MASKNFYELLELDPSVKDRAQIEKVIERKHKEWVRWSDNPVREGEARLCLGLLPRIRKVLLAPGFESERQAQEDEYRELNKSDAEKLDEMLLLDAGKELRILESRFKELLGSFAKTFKNQFTAHQIREHCRQLRISIVPEGPKEPGELPIAIYRDIEKNLSIAAENDLYSMLKAPFGLKDRQRLLTAAESVLKEARLRPNQAVWTARAVLAGHCLAIFKTDAMQSCYDHTAQNARIGRVLNQFIDQAAHDGVLTPHEWEHLLKKAREAEISEEIATRYITKRLNDRSGGKGSAAFDKHIKAAYDLLESSQLTAAIEELERARSLQPDHSEVALLENRITERQNLGKSEAELRAAILADNSERTIANASNRRAEFTDKELAPSENKRITEAQMRVQLLDRFSGVPSEPTQVDDEAFMSLWEQSPDAVNRLSKSRDPECRKVLKLADDVRRRLQRIRMLQTAAETADRNEAKECDLLVIACELPRGYRHVMQPRLAMSAALLRVPPDSAAKTDAWIKLKSSGYNLQECYFRHHCEELAMNNAARTVLEPLLAIDDEASDRRYLRVWDEYSFASAHLEDRFERRMRHARNRVTILNQLKSIITQVNATLTNELAIVKASEGLPPGFNHDLALRVALARDLVASPQSDLRIADVWEKLREHRGIAIPPDTVKRCEMAILRRNTLSKLRAITVGIDSEYDHEFVKLWHEAELDNVPDAANLKAEFSRASACLAALKEFEQLTLCEPPGLKGEAHWVQVNHRLPTEYRHPWKVRVELALALTSSPMIESRIADNWVRLAGSSVVPSGNELQSRCRLAVQRSTALNRLLAMESARVSQELRDKTFVEVWDKALFDGCSEADRWREEATEALLRGRDLMELEQALRDGVDYLKIKRFASSPRLTQHHPALARYRTQIDEACKQAELIEQIQQCIREGRGRDSFNAFELSGTIRNHKVLNYYWPELGDFVAQWWQTRLNLRPGDREYVVSPDRRQVYITWKFYDPGFETMFEFATSAECHSEDLCNESLRQRTQKISISELAAMGGRISLPAPPSGKSLFVTVWAVADCAGHVLVSEPLNIGPIRNVQGKSEKTRGKSWRSYLWRLLNN